MKCPKCQFDNLEGAMFCNECGSKLELACPDCGKMNPFDSKFCNECGHDLRKIKEAPPVDYDQPQSYTPKHLVDKIFTTRSSIEGERKLVTVLFADVANYTSICEKLDPEEVHQIMDGCFKILMDEIHRYEGTINQFMGDGIMALFGAPVAHEDHAQRACHAALAVQRSLEGYSEELEKRFGLEFKMRVGLNSGPVVVGSIGDDLRMDYTAIGDTTNLAARMESMARAGTIVGTAYTYKLARDYFDFTFLGKVQVKGKKEVQEVYELIKASDVKTRIEAAVARGLTRFVGRTREAETLKEAYNKAQSGSGQVVGVVGEAGVGKSRLLLELRNMLPKGEYTYMEGRCLHYGGSMAYLPILDILRSYFNIKEGDREAEIKEKMEEKVLQLDENLKSTFPPFQEVFSIKVEDQTYLIVEPQEKRMRTFEAIRNLLVRESQNRPLVLAVEDLHWIDKSSEEFLDYLIGWLANTQILLILIYRPEYTHQWGSKSYYSKIGLDQLSTKTSAELVQSILEGAEVLPELREFILNRAAGNPLFMEELTHTLLENGAIEKKDDQYVLSKTVEEIQVPDTIQGIIAARMDRLEDTLKRVMQVASVVGREFVFRVLQTTIGVKEELKSYLLKLQGLELVSEKQLFPELKYIFKHALTQEVAYNSLLHKRRKEIHEKIGRAVEDLYLERIEEYYELLAYHYTRSDNTEKALQYLCLANQKAAKVTAMEEALTYFDEAMKLLDTLSGTEKNRQRRISLLVNQWLVFLMLSKSPEYLELLTRYEPIAVGLSNPGLLGLFYSGMVVSEYWLGNFDTAIQKATKAVELCQAAGNFEGAGLAYMVIQWSYLYKGDYDKAIALKEDTLLMTEKQFNLRVYMWAFAAVSYAYTWLGRWDEAVREGQEAMRIAEEYSAKSIISFAALGLSFAYTAKGDLARGKEYAELSINKGPTPTDKLWSLGGLAESLIRAGELHRGIEIQSDLLPKFRAVRYCIGEVESLLCLGEGYYLAGEYNKAKQMLKECLNLSDRCGMKVYVAGARRLLGEISLKTNPAQAAGHFEKSISIYQEIKVENELAKAYAGYGRFHKQNDNMAQARVYLTKALEIFERLGTLIEPDKVRKELTGLPEA
jgi:class 3 adenylate cyclase/tetratricopeptide (TPR) repeat protein